MARFEIISGWRGREAVLPPLTKSITLSVQHGEAETASRDDSEPSPISAFLCIIEYEGDTRLITCRRYDGIGEHRYVGGICHVAKGYRQFRCDRIGAVYDAQTGEILGNGAFFDRFALDEWRERAPTWGLNSGAKSHLVAGLNILAFMARCDGQWHSAEAQVVESFIVSLWIRKNWPGDPDVTEIVAHTERLAPDANVFFKALARYADDHVSRTVLRRSIGDLISADGRICPAEMDWAGEVEEFLGDFDALQMRDLLSDSD